MPDFGFEHWPSGMEATVPGGASAYASEEAEGSIPLPEQPPEKVQRGLAQALGVNTLSLDVAIGTGNEPYESGETPPHIPAHFIPEAADAPSAAEGGAGNGQPPFIADAPTGGEDHSNTPEDSGSTDHQMPAGKALDESRDAAGAEASDAIPETLDTINAEIDRIAEAGKTLEDTIEHKVPNFFKIFDSCVDRTINDLPSGEVDDMSSIVTGVLAAMPDAMGRQLFDTVHEDLAAFLDLFVKKEALEAKRDEVALNEYKEREEGISDQ